MLILQPINGKVSSLNFLKKLSNFLVLRQRVCFKHWSNLKISSNFHILSTHNLMIVKQTTIINWCIHSIWIQVSSVLCTFCLRITQVYAHAHVKSWTGRVQLTVSKNLCKQNVKWKPTVYAHFYAKLDFGSVNASIQQIPNAEKKTLSWTLISTYITQSTKRSSTLISDRCVVTRRVPLRHDVKCRTVLWRKMR